MSDNLPTRKPIRLKHHDYSRDGYYFITICTKNKQNLLSNVGTTALGRPHIELTPLGKCVDETIQIANKNNVKIDKYIIMPNHIHMIVILEQSTDDPSTLCVRRSSLQQVVRNIKSYTTKWVGLSVWQHSFHDHIIRDSEAYQKIWNYINENPTTWEDDRYYTQ